MQGIPLGFLPLVHHCLLVYSPQVADFIRDKGFDLYAKSDYRFMESTYKLLVDSFRYKPAISIDQFFKDGFAEHKIILCKDIATLMRQKHGELSKTAPSKASLPGGSSYAPPSLSELAELHQKPAQSQGIRVVRH